MKIIFFDVETTGLPVSWKENYRNKANWPYIVQLAFIISHQEDEISEEQDFILKPEGFTIPSQSTRIHRVSNEVALKKGLSRNQVLHLFAAHLKNSDYIVAHNADFDINVLRCEFLRNNIEDPFKEDLNIICTMKKSIDFCKIPSAYGNYKWPSLQELYAKLFDKSFKDAHDAKFDVKATFECFWKLNQLNVIQVNKIKHSQGTVFNKNFLFSFFKKRGDIFYDLLSNYYPLDENLLCLLDAELNWDNVSENTEIEWNIDIIERFQDKWDSDAEHSGWPMGRIKWYGLSRNTGIPWSIELIKMFKDKWAFENQSEYNTGSLSTNQSLPWCDDLLTEFYDEWNWNELSSSSFLPWSQTFIAKYLNKWKWEVLSSNESLPWSQILIAKYIDKWDWASLSSNEILPWSIDFIAKYQDYWGWHSINQMIVDGKIKLTTKEVLKAYFDDRIKTQYMAYLPLNEEFLDLAIDSWEFRWDSLGGYGILPWSARLIKKYLPKMGLYSYIYNDSIDWNIELLHQLDDILLWSHFAYNENFNWGEQFFKEFDHKINFDETLHDSYKMNWLYLKKNKAIVWTDFLLERYYDYLREDKDFWKELSWNNLNAHWSPSIIQNYFEHWDWRGLSRNENLCWSDGLIHKYENYWDWYGLSLNDSIKWSVNTLEFYLNCFRNDDYDFCSDADLFRNVGASSIISYLSEKLPNKEIIPNPFLDDTEFFSSYYELWEYSKAELNGDFIIEIHNAIKNESSRNTNG